MKCSEKTNEQRQKIDHQLPGVKAKGKYKSMRDFIGMMEIFGKLIYDGQTSHDQFTKNTEFYTCIMFVSGKALNMIT